MAKLTAKQEEQFELFNSGARYILCAGGSRSAKTFGIMLYILTSALAVPKSRYLICRKTLSQVLKSVYEETFKEVVDIFYPELDGQYRYRGQPYYTIELPNGSEIVFGGLDDAERIDKILGKEYSYIFFNEASEISYRAFTTAVSRLAQKNDLVKKFLIDLNPVGNNHWAYRLFIDKVEPSTNKPLSNGNDYVWLQMNPVDNLENIDPKYLESLENLPESEKKRFLYGEWADAGEVVVFQPNWLRRYRQIPSFRYVVQSWDTGQKDKDFNDPSACTTWGIGEDGYYLLDIVNKRMEYPTLKNFVYEHANRWRANEVVIEDKASGISLIQDLKYQTRLPIVGFNPGSTGKTVRAATAAQYFEKGLVWLPDTHDLIDDYISQLLMFPFTEHDDMVDSTSNFLLYAKDQMWDYANSLDFYEDEDDNGGYENMQMIESPTGY